MHEGRFQNLTDRVRNRCNAWDERCLSAGGKDVLIKAVAQAIPVYMSGFKLPASIHESLEGSIQIFFWLSTGGNTPHLILFVWSRSLLETHQIQSFTSQSLQGQLHRGIRKLHHASITILWKVCCVHLLVCRKYILSVRAFGSWLLRFNINRWEFPLEIFFAYVWIYHSSFMVKAAGVFGT